MFNAVKSTAKEELVTEAATSEFVIDYIQFISIQNSIQGCD